MTTFKNPSLKNFNDQRIRTRALRMASLLLMLEETPGISRTKMRRSLGVTKYTLRKYMIALEAAGRLPKGAFKAYRDQGRAMRHRRHLRRKRRMLTQKPLTRKKRRRLLLKMLTRNPALSLKYLASKLGRSIRTIERDRTELRRLGYITGKGRKLIVTTSLVAARRELKMRKLIKLLKENPESLRAHIASTLSIGTTTVQTYVKILQGRGDLPENFKLKPSIPREKTITRREQRRHRVLACISRDWTMREIARSLEVYITSIIKDIEFMRRSGDPGLIEAEKQRDELRARIPPSKTERERAQALEEIGLTAEEFRADYLDWMENAGPDDPLTRAKI